MCNIQIQKLNREDLSTIKPLWQELNAHHRQRSAHFENHFATLTFEHRIEQLIVKENLVIYLAKDKNEPVGYCVATATQGHGEIDSLYIKETYRGQKIGDQLMKNGLDWLKKQACEEIHIYIASGNESVVDFYRQFGFEERFVVMQNINNLD